MAENTMGAHIPFAGEFNNSLVIIGGSGATLLMTFYIEAYGAPKKIEDLMQHHCLIFSYPGMHQNIWQLKKGREEKNIAINGTLCSDNGDILHEWCVAGLGVSLRETWDIYDELQSGQLIKVLTDWEAIGSKISLVQPRREIVPKRLTVFNEFLIERWQHAPWDN